MTTDLPHATHVETVILDEPTVACQFSSVQLLVIIFVPIFVSLMLLLILVRLIHVLHFVAVTEWLSLVSWLRLVATSVRAVDTWLVTPLRNIIRCQSAHFMDISIDL